MKFDHQPLLGPGKHYMSLNHLERLTTTFGDVSHRENLFAHLNELHSEIVSLGIRVDLWVDGSFVTEKAQPSDIDGVIAIHADEFDACTTEVQDFLDGFNDDAFSDPPILDFFTHIIYDSDDPRREIEESSWEWQWSKQHDEKHLKGFASIVVGGAKYEPF